MNKTVRCLIAFVFLFVFWGQGTPALAATYYVDTAVGDDSTGTGAQGAPWKTMIKAETAALDGDTVNVKTGTYVEPSAVGGTSGGITFTKAITWVGRSADWTGDGMVTLREYTNTATAIITGNTNATSFTNFIFDGQGTVTSHVVRIFGAGHANKSFTNCTFQGGTSSGALLRADNGGTVNFTACTFTHTANYIFNVADAGILVDGGTINTTGGGVITSTSTKTMTLHDTDITVTNPASIVFYEPNASYIGALVISRDSATKGSLTVTGAAANDIIFWTGSVTLQGTAANNLTVNTAGTNGFFLDDQSSGAVDAISYTNLTHAMSGTSGKALYFQGASLTLDHSVVDVTGGSRLLEMASASVLTMASNTITYHAASTVSVFYLNSTGAASITDNEIDVVSGNSSSIGTMFSKVLASRTATGKLTLTGNGIQIDTPFTYVLRLSFSDCDVEISGNTIDANSTSVDGVYVIYLQDVPNPVITNNTITSASTGAVDHIVVAPSDVVNWTGTGVADISDNTSYTKSHTGHVIQLGQDTSSGSSYEQKWNGSTVEHNTIYGPAYYGDTASYSTHDILIGHSIKCLVRYNKVIGGGLAMVIKDGTATGLDWNHEGGVYGNVIINPTYGAILSKGALNLDIYNNSVYVSSTYGISYVIGIGENLSTYPSTGNRVFNNIFYSRSDRKLIAVDQYSTTGFLAYDNIYWNEAGSLATQTFEFNSAAVNGFTAWNTAIGGGDTSQGADPRFKTVAALASANSDLALRSDSPAIDAATAVASLTADHLGNRINGTLDIGAYEYYTPETIALVSNAGTGVTYLEGGATSIQVAASHTQGNLIAAYLAVYGVNAALSVTDSQGNSYSPVGSAYKSTGPNAGVTGQWFYAYAGATGSNTVTGHFANANYYSLRVLEYSGIAAYAPAAYTAGDGAPSSAFSTTNANNLVLAAFHAEGANSCTAGSGYSIIEGTCPEIFAIRPVEQMVTSSPLDDATAGITAAGRTVYGNWVVVFKGVTPVATSYALTAPDPASGTVDAASGNFTVTPNGIYTGTITVTPSGGGLSTPITLTFNNSFSAQTFTITPTSAGTVTLTPTDSGSLTDPAAVTYEAAASSGPAATPTFSVAAGSYDHVQSVTISSATAGASIYYTTDGTDPTVSSTLYSGTVYVTASQTLKAIAVKSGYDNSAVGSAAYTITGTGQITFTTTGSTFAPIIKVTGTPTILWVFPDGTSSSVATPTIDFGTAATRTTVLYVSPWSAVTDINLGYNHADGGINNESIIATQAQQNVTTITGLSNVASSLVTFAASFNPITSLDFSNFSVLERLECYNCTALTSIELHGTSALFRLCLENANLTALDLSETPELADLRGALQGPTDTNVFTINWGSIGEHVWHICIRDNYGQTSPTLPYDQLPLLRELFVWGTVQNGTFAPASTHLTSVQASYNSYTSVDLAGLFAAGRSEGNGYVDLDHNLITSVDITNDPGLTTLKLHHNALNQAAVDGILATLDGFNTSNGTLDLSENAAPSVAGNADVVSLRGRGWTVTVAPSSTKAVTAFDLASPAATGTIDEGAHTVALTVPYGTAVTALVPTIVITGASVSPASGVAQDFTGSVTYTVTAADASTQEYVVTVTVAAASDDSALSALAISQGTLTPTFASGTTTYTASVANGITSMTVTPTVHQANATVTVEGVAVTSGSASGAINLSVGSNTLNIVVTAQDLTTTEYIVTVTRATASSGGGGATIKPTASVPSFSPAAGTYAAAQTVAISSATSGAIIYYTLDGSVPTTASLVYSAPLTVSATTTVKALAIKSGYKNSAVASAAYVIDAGVVVSPTTPVTPGVPVVPPAPSSRPEGTLIKLPDSFRVYVVINGMKKWISTPEVFEQLGYKWTDIATVTRAELDLIADFEDNLIRQTGDYKVYLVVNGVRRHIPNPTIFLGYGFAWTDVKDVPAETMNKYKNASLIKESGRPDIYFVAGGVRKLIPSMDIFYSYGDKMEDVQVVSKAELESYPLTYLIRLAGDNEVYYIGGATKKLIPSPDVFLKYGFDWTRIVGVNRTEFDYYADGGTLE